MIRALKVFFGFVCVFMIVLSVRVSLQENILGGIPKIWNEPWALATLADAYFGFLTFYIWVLYKESGWRARLLWFLLIMALGNIVMSFYMLIQLFRLKPGEDFENLLLRRRE